jgi:nitrile hydratase subunit beta
VDGIADMGGTQGWGALQPPRDDEPVFAEPWQARTFAMALLSWGAMTGYNLDAFRHAVERLDRAAYLDDGYYGRWLNASELILTECAILAPGAVEARIRNMNGEQVEEPPLLEPVLPDYTPTDWGWRRAVDSAPAFAVGERVRAKDMAPAGHTRLAGYVRGRIGVVELIQPAAVLPDTHAHFQGENPQHVYSVRFDSHELWGADAESFVVTIELYESYLEKIA